MKLFNKKLKKGEEKTTDDFFNPKVLEVNLVKDEISVEFNWSRHLLSLFLAIFVAALLVAEIYYGLDWWQKQEEEKTVALKIELDKVSQEIKNINRNAKDFVSFKEKLELTKKMADTHIYWTNFFDWLEKNTLNSVNYQGFSGDISGEYSLSATARTFSDISWQVKTFKDNKYVISAEVDSGSSGKSDKEGEVSGGSSVSFSINLKVKPEIFYKQVE